MKKEQFFLGILVVLMAAFMGYVLWQHENTEYRTDISELADDPDWSLLQKVSSDIDAVEFEQKLTSYFTVGDSWRDEFSLSNEGIYDSNGQLLYSFGKSDSAESLRYWRTKEEMSVRSQDKPLEGVKITLDPGHIGGKCAKMEERWFKIGESLPVMEGEMTLLVAQMIKPKLEALGAIVTFTRDENKPVSKMRTPHFRALAKAKVEKLNLDSALTEAYADKLFYRTSEIRTRAAKVNMRLQPDIAIALHFNAEAWGDPTNPQLTENNHFHILVNGAYTAGEIKKADQRFEMLKRILEGSIDEEIALSEAFVEAFKRETQLPPYQYEPNSQRAKPVDAEGYIWARNLLANRLFECPTIFLEPYIMNSQPVFDRIQLGDYEGEKEVNGEMRKSIFREYADAVVSALVSYYSN